MTSVKINLPHVVHEVFEDEVVIVNLDTGNYYSLDGAGADIWRDIELGLPVDAIADAAARRFSGSTEEIKTAVRDLVTELHQEQLVSFVDASDNQGSTVSNSNGEHESSSEKPRFQTPVLNRFSDMQELLLLDPVHDVDETGWPSQKQSPDAMAESK